MEQLGLLLLAAAWWLAFSAARSNRISDDWYRAFDALRLKELGNQRSLDPFVPISFATALSYANVETLRRQHLLLKDTAGRYLEPWPNA